ncbi:MAG TPA: GNAT family N-acetyltransferase, partial [Anaerolineaceae bacterium]|nr:GNAT family N-acetyltransferase [Anaerolineaceae bacterium]
MDASPTIPRLPVNLGDGLRLRRATPADGEALAAFNHQIHETHPDRPPDHRLETWVRDLISGRHPTFRVEDFTLVEDQSSGKIVSSANLISQVWSYEGISFRVGRPELVGTDPQYRNRGLVRKQFDVLHAWSAARGELAQAITGIPFYYRLFGYEMAVDLGGGRQYAIPQQIPKLKEGDSEPFQIRPAVEADLPFLARCYRQGQGRWLLSANWDEDLLRYELLGKHPDNVNRVVLEVIQSQAGEAVGFFTHPAYLLGSPERTAVTYLELVPGTSWYAAVPAVMRHMVRLGQQMVTAEKKEPLDAVELHLGPEHPAYDVVAYQCTADPRP